MVPLYDVFNAAERGADLGLVNFALPLSEEYFAGLPHVYKLRLIALSRNGMKELQDGSSGFKIVVCHSTADVS